MDLASLDTSFNPRAREGRDPVSPSTVRPVALFQSTRPRGARQDTSFRIYGQTQVSIHAPARGAT